MNDQHDLARQRVLIAALARALEQEVGHVEQFETHISWVLVAGEFAYKFKKAVQFDFLDFSTLHARRFYCQEEVRLNTRLAPQIYLSVCAVCGSAEQPSFDAGEAIEYCVQMRAFAQDAIWSWRLRHGLLSGAEIDDLAHRIARFHLDADCAPPGAWYGNAEQLLQVAYDNHAQIIGVVSGAPYEAACDIQTWTVQQVARLAAVFAARKCLGFIRECHGDLHAGNIVTLGGRAQAFDCIEFNDELRWIDVINDIAFTYMDLRFQGRDDLAARCLNRYLEITGDYEGIQLLRYYHVQRAMVRCKIALLYASQAGISTHDAIEHEREGLRYLEYAKRNISTGTGAIMITHGFSGCGKSVFARYVVESVGALQLRSDVERKRMHDTDPLDRTTHPVASGLYAKEATRRTYARLLELARMLTLEGMPVVVDAAFLGKAQRHDFMALADELKARFIIFDLHASEATMRDRVERRRAQGEDASDADLEVLMHQLRNHDPLSADEQRFTVQVDADSDMDLLDVRALCEQSGLCKPD